MQIFKKEKRVVELALEHADKTGECLAIMTSAVKAFILTNNSNLDKATRDVNALETAADGLLRDIRELLYSGAYLPTIRGDLYRQIFRGTWRSYAVHEMPAHLASSTCNLRRCDNR